MASVSSYIQQMSQSTGISQKALAQFIAELGGTTNPTQDNYTPAEKIEVTDPTLRTAQQYLEQLGLTDYQYNYDDILSALNAASAAGQEAQQNELTNTQAQYNRSLASNQATAADTIRNQYAAAIQSGMSKGMQNANLLSTLLGTSQSAAEGAQELAAERVQAAKDYAAELAGNANTALNTSNSAMETLMGNIRQLYNDEIQEKTADLEYNASLEETLANYLASKYTADTNYANNIITNGTNAYNTNNTALSSIASAAGSAAAQDNYSAAYKAAQEALANATIQAAQISAQATRDAAATNAAAYKNTATTTTTPAASTTAKSAATALQSALNAATKKQTTTSTSSKLPTTNLLTGLKYLT